MSRFGVRIYFPSPERREFETIVLELAARAESCSTHPIARSVMEAYAEIGEIAESDFTGAKEIAGRGKKMEYLFVWRKGHTLPVIEEDFIDFVKAMIASGEAEDN